MNMYKGVKQHVWPNLLRNSFQFSKVSDPIWESVHFTFEDNG